MARTVSMDFLFYVTDFIVDELSQNAHLASEVKSRVRAAAQNFPNADMEGEVGQAGAKRKGAPGGTAGDGQAKAVKMQDADNRANGAANEEPAGKKKKKENKRRKVSAHQIFMSAAMESLSVEVKNKYKQAFSLLGKFKKSIPAEKLERFVEDYTPVLTAVNDAAERVPDDLKILLRNRRKELGVEHHAVFDELEDFLHENHTPAEDSKDSGEKAALDAEKTPKTEVKKEDVPDKGDKGDKGASAPATDGKKKKGKGSGSPTKRQKAAQEDSKDSTALEKALAGGSKSKKKAKETIPKPSPAQKGVQQQNDTDDEEDDDDEEEAPLPTKGKSKGKYILAPVEESASEHEDGSDSSDEDEDSDEDSD